jgi:hypothetical protein
VSLDVYLTAVRPTQIFDMNITHNLGKMAREAGVYEALWRPEEVGIKTAAQLISPLRAGLEALRANPEAFKKLNPDNGWGNYENLVEFVETYLFACEQNPDAEVSVSR